MSELEAKAARQSSVVYITLSLVITFIFLGITLLNGNYYTAVARIGGMVWVFILSMIVFMPIVIPVIKKRVLG